MKPEIHSIERGVRFDKSPDVEYARVSFVVRVGWEDAIIPVVLPIRYGKQGEPGVPLYDDGRLIAVARHYAYAFFSDMAQITADWEESPSGLQYDFLPEGWEQP